MPGCDDDRRADRRAVAVDEVEHARRHAGLVQDLGEDDRVERRDLGRLQHHRAAGGERRRDLAGDLVDRPVPRRDHADDADRLRGDGVVPRTCSNSKSSSDLDRLAEMRDAHRGLRVVGSEIGAPISRRSVSAISG